MRAIQKFTVQPRIPSPIAHLDALARNLRWSWEQETKEVFAQIDPGLWHETGQDPLALLRRTPPERLEELAASASYIERVDRAHADLTRYLTAPRWYQNLNRPGLPRSIAYFSPEFGISESLPQYSGGLGILAGDHLKSASDLGVPLIGVGLLYGSGYFRQGLTRDGWQSEEYPHLNPAELPLELIQEADGATSLIKISLPGGRELHAQVWCARVGRVPLLLLDSNVPENDDELRQVTDRLYGGSGEKRLQQEMLLGIGGVRALRLWERRTDSPAPEVYHTNEGHAGFLGIERIGELMAAGLGFAEGLEAVRSGTLFTTHTPVPAGIDRFDMELVRRHFEYPGAVPGVHATDVLELGAETYEGGNPTVFNMAVMGLRLAQRANGVSKLHGEVSREMFGGLWPGFPSREVPITSVTNGIHAPTWVDDRMRVLAQENLQVDDVMGERGWADPELISDNTLWKTRREMRGQLVADVRARLRRSWLERGASPAELAWTSEALDPDVLTIGFARRVPTYKRLTLMLREPERLKAALLHPEHPVQLIVAGKSHPEDEQGKQLIQQLVQFADENDVRHRIVFLPDYDIGMAQKLYPGCDVWLNNPLRPFEACGTSGMKAALNGGLNLSILDGWWNEWAQDQKNGWVIPSADGVSDPEHRDDLEAAALYDLLETQVAPKFYETDASGLPREWLKMVRTALDTLHPRVHATRMVAEYVERLYVPAAGSARQLQERDFSAAREFAAWKARVREAWPALAIDHVETALAPATSGTPGSPEVGDALEVAAYISLGALAPEDVRVQAIFGQVTEDNALEPERVTELPLQQNFSDGRYKFGTAARFDSAGSVGVGVRVLPQHRALAHDAEVSCITTT